jgi:hypothetical protein
MPKYHQPRKTWRYPDKFEEELDAFRVKYQALAKTARK